ncbi:MAG: IclR family transcriptional regulator [Microbacteriaceae bacterium]
MNVVVRALSVVKLLAKFPAGLSQADVAEKLELPVPTAYRLLSVLEREGFATRSQSNRKYFLGPAASEIGRQAEQHGSLSSQMNPVLQEAGKSLAETVFLSERSGNQIICTALVEAQRPLRLFVHQGQIMPAHAAASARVILAWSEQSVIEGVLGANDWKHYTTGTITSPDALRVKLNEIRERGFDVCESELDRDVWAVSAPVYSSLNEIVASVTMAAPAQRFLDKAKQEDAVRIIVEAAKSLSQEIGGAS